jgi:hypothetical protein
MNTRILRTAQLALLVLFSVPAARGQQAPPATKCPEGTTCDPVITGNTIKNLPLRHRFWDRENILLFAGVGIGRGLDYASTLNIRRRGINEVFLTNAIVDNHPLFAGIEVGGAAASIGVSYVFHRTGHHSLERWTSVVHIGVAVGGAARNYALKTPHAE